MRARAGLALLPLALAAGLAGAEEWYDAYRQGVRALAQGRPGAAVAPLERAIAQRPEPGRNVLTYGTNVEREYFPYVHLAEAHLQLRDHARAQAALERSEKWGREPAEHRQRLAARIEDLVPKSTPTPAPPATAPPSTLAPVVTTLPVAPPATTQPSVAPPAAGTAPRQAIEPAPPATIRAAGDARS